MNIEDRITTLERRVRLSRWTNIGLVGLVAFLLALSSCETSTPVQQGTPSQAASGSSQSEYIRARHIQLVDEAGNTLVELGVLNGGGVVRVFQSGSTQAAAVIMAEEDGGTVATLLKDSSIGVQIGNNEGGRGGHVTIFNAAGERSVSLQANKMSCGDVRIFNPTGKLAVLLQANKMNCGIISVHDYNGNFVDGLLGKP